MGFSANNNLSPELLGKITPKIISVTETAVSLLPENNTEYRCGETASLIITLPDTIPEDYGVYIVFTSGETETGISYPETLKWHGDDVTDGVFVPLPLRRYSIGIWYDGIMNAEVRGVSV